jgi:hypothetical protein
MMREASGAKRGRRANAKARPEEEKHAPLLTPELMPGKAISAEKKS